MKERKAERRWVKLIKRKKRGHPDNIRRIYQFLISSGVTCVDGESYVLMEAKDATKFEA